MIIADLKGITVVQTTTAILESAEMADGQSSIAGQLASIFVSAGTGSLPSAVARVVRESSKIVSLLASLAAIKNIARYGKLGTTPGYVLSHAQLKQWTFYRPQTFTQPNQPCDWLILGQLLLSKFKLDPVPRVNSCPSSYQVSKIVEIF